MGLFICTRYRCTHLCRQPDTHTHIYIYICFRTERTVFCQQRELIWSQNKCSACCNADETKIGPAGLGVDTTEKRIPVLY